MDKILKNLYVISKTYNELYKCCEKLSGSYLDLEEKESVYKKDSFKDLLVKYNKSEKDFIIGINDIKVIFDRSMMEISEGMAEIIDLIKSTSYGPDMQGKPQILSLNPSALSIALSLRSRPSASPTPPISTALLHDRAASERHFRTTLSRSEASSGCGVVKLCEAAQSWSSPMPPISTALLQNGAAPRLRCVTLLDNAAALATAS